ncbi:MAG: ASKHA domain-containing protein [Planctomycetota bacterium]
MHNKIKLTLIPSGKIMEAERGASLQDILFDCGMEFPCGGQVRCKCCLIKVLKGNLPVTEEQKKNLSEKEISSGWRLACCCKIYEDVTVELPQLGAVFLSDNSTFSFEPKEGFAVVFDLGTTTIVAQLVDLINGQISGVRTALNLQSKYGSDVMSRVQTALNKTGLKKLCSIIRKQIGEMTAELISNLKSDSLQKTSVFIVGNTVMHHLFCGIDVEPLSHYPFVPVDAGMQVFRADKLDWKLPDATEVRFLPCIGSFVGSDILAGIAATKIDKAKKLTGLIDLGTNGEIVFGNEKKILCASTAAGPAFEGAHISAGMRADAGAVYKIAVKDGKFICQVIGGVSPRGICGSGLVDAVAAGIELGFINENGSLSGNNNEIEICPNVSITGKDIRELQLAKGAVYAGIRILLERLNAKIEDVDKIYLAGAFGNYVDCYNAWRIGLFDFPVKKIVSAGNTALLGAKMIAFSANSENETYSEIINITEHVSLNSDLGFQNVFVESLSFPKNRMLK